MPVFIRHSAQPGMSSEYTAMKMVSLKLSTKDLIHFFQRIRLEGLDLQSTAIRYVALQDLTLNLRGHGKEKRAGIRNVVCQESPPIFLDVGQGL